MRWDPFGALRGAAVLAGLSAALLSGATPDRYIVWVPNAADIGPVVAAAADWSAHVPVTFMVVRGQCLGSGLASIVCVQIVPPEVMAQHHVAWAWGYTFPGNNILVDAAAPDVHQVLTHEIGHAMGLRHSAVPGSIMFAYSEPHEEIGCTDVAQWYIVRNRPVPQCGAPSPEAK